MAKQLTTQCCIAGGGPAAMMLGFLLARAGVDCVILEKHADFLRDFRGDTVHPSTLELMHELGLLQEFLKEPHQETRQLKGMIGDSEVTIADFSYLSTYCRFIALMPQWDFLNFLARHGKKYKGFRLMMQAEVTDVIEEDGRVVGVKAKTPEGQIEVLSPLVVGADGRHSTVRARAGLVVQDIGAPMDVFWLRISRKSSDPDETFGRFLPGKMMAMINRQEYWQCGYVIPKGSADVIRQQGLPALREAVATAMPFLADRVQELASWDDAKLLTITIDRLRQWCRPGLLCIGDAAHAMSPVGGVGINLAVQDAVAAANILAVPLRENRVNESHLQAVQKRREFPMRVIQFIQVLVQDKLIRRVLQSNKPFTLPWPVKLMQKLPWLGAIPAYIVGVGVRPEHIRTEEISTY